MAISSNYHKLSETLYFTVLVQLLFPMELCYWTFQELLSQHINAPMSMLFWDRTTVGFIAEGKYSTQTVK